MSVHEHQQNFTPPTYTGGANMLNVGLGANKYVVVILVFCARLCTTRASKQYTFLLFETTIQLYFTTKNNDHYVIVLAFAPLRNQQPTNIRQTEEPGVDGITIAEYVWSTLDKTLCV